MDKTHRRLLIAVAVTLILAVAACRQNPDIVRKQHESKKGAVFGEGTVAGRVVFAVAEQAVPAAGANILVMDTDSGKQVLEHLQKEAGKTCTDQLADMETFVIEAAKAATQAGRLTPTATADADGFFLVPHLKPGAYLVVAYGRAGETQAIWEQPAIIERYQAITLKLVNPLMSCSGNEQNPQPKSPPHPTAAPPGASPKP